MQDRRAELRAKLLDRIAAREGLDTEEDMDPRRRKALDDLVDSFRRKRERGA
jgi:hypothetical protein